MSTRRSRPPRARKARASEAPQNDVAILASAVDPLAQLSRSVDPTETSQLRALEAGWDELLT
ncbi:MAG TPA: hypothetical protein VIJ22_07145 [Polyangiaceae bacterium]